MSSQQYLRKLPRGTLVKALIVQIVLVQGALSDEVQNAPKNPLSAEDMAFIKGNQLAGNLVDSLQTVMNSGLAIRIGD